MVQVGDRFRTGEAAPASGEYEYVQHIDSYGCEPTQYERRVTLSKGERFPPHKSCSRSVVWRLTYY
ncbi:MAG: YjzC family protein [Nitrososphaerales archaeon]